ERRIARLVHVVGTPVDPDPRAVLPPFVAELRRELDLVAPAGNRLTDEPLVRERAVHVGGVEERDTEIERAVDGRDRLVVVAAGTVSGSSAASRAIASIASTNASSVSFASVSVGSIISASGTISGK